MNLSMMKKKKLSNYSLLFACVVKLVDTLDSKSSGVIRAGSSPATGTIGKLVELIDFKYMKG